MTNTFIAVKSYTSKLEFPISIRFLGQVSETFVRKDCQLHRKRKQTSSKTNNSEFPPRKFALANWRNLAGKIGDCSAGTFREFERSNGRKEIGGTSVVVRLPRSEVSLSRKYNGKLRAAGARSAHTTVNSPLLQLLIPEFRSSLRGDDARGIRETTTFASLFN